MSALGGGIGLFITASGLRDAQLRMNVVSHNVANANTEGFVPDRVASTAEPNGGVTSRIEPAFSPSAPPPYSMTELSTEGVSLILAKAAYQANAALLRTHADTSHTLLDTFA